jgi:hypothetical protein
MSLKFWKLSTLQDIENKGIGGNFLKLIKDMYFNTLYSCKFGDSYSEPFLTTLTYRNSCPRHLDSVVNQLEILRGLLNHLHIIDD